MSVTDQATIALGMPLPANIRKVTDAADDNKWQLHGKGATLVTQDEVTSFTLRLDKPDDELAVPFYVTWRHGYTEKGNESWRQTSAGAAILQNMLVKDVLACLNDPTIIWPDFTEGDSSDESSA